MKDILPEESVLWQQLEHSIREVLRSYGYVEIRLPLLEHTELFARSIGEVTDIVEKEMYTFSDRNGDSLSLRPEGTAGCVRAMIQNGMLHRQVHRLWYSGPMFRHERPQKGRFRQFHQVGAEAFGLQGPDIDAELILMNARMWRRLGLRDIRLQINSIGTAASRRAYRERLVEYFAHHRSRLDEDSIRRLHTNPLRILDSKNPQMQDLIGAAPSLEEALDAESREHFTELQRLLQAGGQDFEVNTRLVRGLDYYTKTVFEWLSDELGAQNTVCAGGRYDGLVEQIGGRSTPAVGFAMGLERLVAMLEESGRHAPAAGPDFYLIAIESEYLPALMGFAETLRDAYPELSLVVHCGGGSLKSQMRRADRCGASFAVIVGENEHHSDSVSVKRMRGEADQQMIKREQFLESVPSLLAGSGASASGT